MSKSKSDSVSFEVASEEEGQEAKRYTLRLTPSAWIELEDAGLGNVQTLATTLEKEPSFKTFAKVFAAALRGGTDKSITDEQAMEVADFVGSEGVIKKIGEVVQASFPDAADKAKKGEAGNGQAKA